MINKFGLALILLTISSKAGLDIHPDSLTIAREHCPKDKMRAIVNEDGWTDHSDLRRVCDKSGLTRITYSWQI